MWKKLDRAQREVPPVERTIMKKLTSVLGIALLAVTMAGCSTAEAEPKPTAPNVEPATADSNESTEGTESGEKSERGNLKKEIGEPASVTVPNQAEDDLVSFAVQEITADPACTNQYAQEPENGHFVAIDIAAETGPANLFEEYYYGTDFSFSNGLWKFVAPNGTTANNVSSGPSFSCFDQAEMLPATIGPGEKVTGKVLLDVPNSQGTIIFSDVASDAGWEWKIPNN